MSKFWLPLVPVICSDSRPPVGAFGVHVGEMREVGREGEIAERRQAMGLDGVVGKRGERATDERRQRPARAGLQRRPAGQCHGHRIVRLVARCFARCTAPQRSSPASAAKTRRRRDAGPESGLNFVHESWSSQAGLGRGLACCRPLPSARAEIQGRAHSQRLIFRKRRERVSSWVAVAPALFGARRKGVAGRHRALPAILPGRCLEGVDRLTSAYFPRCAPKNDAISPNASLLSGNVSSNSYWACDMPS